MAKFFAMTSRGLVDTLRAELEENQFKVTGQEAGGVWFESNWAGCFKANLCLRTATRIVLPILDFPAYQPDELYHNIRRRHDFTKYINPDQTLAVEAHVRESSFHDQRFVALKVKDAVVDQFWEKFDARPNVDVKAADLKIHVRVVRNQVSVAIDTSGESLAFRGYRQEAGQAPLREHLAAGLIRLTGWKADQPIVDVMCGSGTILIEAAMMARQMAPGSLRKSFAFQKFKGFQADVWDQVLEEELAREKEELPFKFYGSDQDGRVLKTAKRNAELAGVDTDIEFKKSPVDLLERPCEKGIIIVNPPYGERLGVTEELKDVYRDLAFTLKRQFKGWTCWLLSGNEELTSALHLKASAKIPVFNGPIECRFLKYEIR